jgi:murein DD-endopeptidase MepM/ murein hydrolase activator NlpD
MHRTVGLLMGLLMTPAAWADSSDDWAVIQERLSTRQQVLQTQHDQAERRTREQASVAYRLQRRRELGFFTSPETRMQDAQTSDVALTALRRLHNENRALSSELEHVQAELHRVERARIAQHDSTEANQAGLKFVRPVRGTVVGEPGIRREAPTGAEIRRDGIEFLARLNEPVRAVAAGVVRKVEPLPQGGYAVLTQHPMGWISITSGLRDLSVQAGEPVAQGQQIGFAGRNLDGAAVISLELWRNRQPVDPRGKLTAFAKL